MFLVIPFRRGIGWHLLRASEELISQMSSAREVYLHCRIIDEAPFNMYTKADYKIVKTDSILVLLTLQRRKHLMCKKLPLLSTPPETDLSVSDEQKTMWMCARVAKYFYKVMLWLYHIAWRHVPVYVMSSFHTILYSNMSYDKFSYL